jgi:hypothetical protein
MDQAFIDTSLYNLVDDPLEQENVIDEHPVIKKSLLKFAESHKEKFFPDQE